MCWKTFFTCTALAVVSSALHLHCTCSTFFTCPAGTISCVESLSSLALHFDFVLHMFTLLTFSFSIVAECCFSYVDGENHLKKSPKTI